MMWIEYSLIDANILSISHVVVYMWSLQITCIIKEKIVYLVVCLNDEEKIEKTIIHPYTTNLSKNIKQLHFNELVVKTYFSN